MYSKKELIQDLLSSGFLIDPQVNTQYFEENHLKVIYHRRGPKLYLAQRLLNDSENISIDLRYGFGAYFDGRFSGITHLIEHLWFSPEINKLCADNNVYKNGWTSAKAIEMNISGLFNLSYPDFSIGKVLQTSIDNFYNHKNVDILERLEKEKEVVLREIREFETDFIRFSLKEFFWKKLVPGHELCTNILGTQDSLMHITNDDIKSFIQSHFDPKQSFIKVFTEGSSEKLDKILGIIDENIENAFEKNNSNKNTFELFEIPEYDYNISTFKEGIREFSTGEKFKDKVIALITVPLDLKVTDINSLILSKFEDCFSDDLFIEVRKQGIAYSSNTWSLRINNETIFFGAYFISTKEAYKANLPKFLQIFKDIITKYKTDTEKWQNEVQQDLIKLEATPIKISEILTDTFEGEIEYGYPVNTFFRKDFFRKLRKENYISLAKLISSKPYSVDIIGDI